jgi:hypothetical protein
MKWLFTAVLAIAWTCLAAAQQADPASDAPEARAVSSAPVRNAASYREALERWRSADDINGWIGAHFEYDMQRAMQLSETQRERGARLPIHEPDAFFFAPNGVCVDLSRFAVETLRRIDPGSKPAYLMIEFSPVAIQGNVLRRHWVARFEHEGQQYFFADSKRPGHMAGPYADTAAYIKDYAAYRGREIVAFRDLESTARTMRMLALKQPRTERP